MTRRIKLLITDDSLPLGGKETLLLQHLDHLDRRVFEVHLVTLTDKGELLPEARKKADYYTCLERRHGLDIRAIWRLRKYLTEHNINIVHTSQWLDSLYVWLAVKGLRIKKIAMIHGYDYSWRQWVNSKLLKSFDCIFSVSHAQKLDLFKGGLPWGKITVIYNTFDANKFNLEYQKGLCRAGDPFRLVMVGRFDWIKDQKTIIEALSILKDQGHHVELDLVGEGDVGFLGTCQSLAAERGLHEAVRFLGKKRVDGKLLSNYDLFVFSSLCDTFGIALLEAMACGLPVIVSDIPPSMELIQHGKCGLYFQASNADNCANEIIKLLKDADLRRSLGLKGHKRAQDFRPEKLTRDLEKAYWDTLNN